jgi:tryptophan synthase alpha chain
MPMPNRLDHAFQPGRPALICYVPLGDPEASAADPDLYASEGVDVLEVGVPERRPSLDGPVVRNSMRRALDNGMTNERASELIRGFRAGPRRPAAVWLTYAPGARQPGFAEAVSASGADGLLVLGDVPAGVRKGIDTHCLWFLPHSPTDEQVADAAEATGYVMLAASEGISGALGGVAAASAARISRLRDAGIRVPIVLGFGITNGAQARRAVSFGADGIAVGTAVLNASMQGPAALRRLLRELRQALDE